MTTIQLHVDTLLDGTHAVRVYHVRPPARLGEPERQEYCGALRLPPALIQQFQQVTPLVEPLVGEECRLVWTGVPIEPLPPNPMLGKVAKLLRGAKRLVGA